MKQKYMIDTKENQLFLKEISRKSAEFWTSVSRHRTGPAIILEMMGLHGKHVTAIHIETCRMHHVYTIGKYLGHEGSEELIDAAIKGLRGAAKDRENGGWFSSVTPDGGHVENKLCYVHAFVILAASDAVLAEYPEGRRITAGCTGYI